MSVDVFYPLQNSCLISGNRQLTLFYSSGYLSYIYISKLLGSNTRTGIRNNGVQRLFYMKIQSIESMDPYSPQLHTVIVLFRHWFHSNQTTELKQDVILYEKDESSFACCFAKSIRASVSKVKDPHTSDLSSYNIVHM